jgi:hypothetical protein
MSDEDTAKITDNSNDHKYFVLVPRIVLALCEDVYQLTTWVIVKDIAGEGGGTCILSVPELASLASMSPSKLHESLHALIEKSLLEGEVKKDPGYHKAVWHLTVPDLWKRNLDWASNNKSLKARVKLKLEQHERSLYERSHERSPGENERSPGENERSPGSVKEEEELKELKEESKTVSQNIWVSLLIDLKNRMWNHELQTYREYFEPTYLLAIEDHTYTVAVPDERRRAWLADRGKDTIERALIGSAGFRPTVQFVIREEIT